MQVIFSFNPFNAICSKLLLFEGFSAILVYPTIFNFWHSVSKTNNGGLDQYGAKPFEQQQFETAGAEGVNM